jgi:hypothetical protein
MRLFASDLATLFVPLRLFDLEPMARQKPLFVPDPIR